MSIYAALYLGTSPVVTAGTGAATPAWTRPADWPALPVLPTNSHKFVGLYGVKNDDSQYVSLMASVSTGTWQVDWGDGTVDSGLASAVKRDHKFEYGTIPGSPGVDGYKYVIVTVTPQTGNLTLFNLNQKHGKSGLPSTYHPNWLDIAINGPNLTSIIVTGTTAALETLKMAKVGVHAVVNLGSLFSACFGLCHAEVSVAPSTSAASLFNTCRSLRTVVMTNTANVQNMSNMFFDCKCLEAVPLFDTSNCNNMNAMFQGCSSLRSIPLFNTAKVTNMANMLQDCKVLKTAPLLNMVAVTTAASMFNGCSALESVPAFNAAACTTMGSMFSNCYALKNVGLMNTAKVASMSNMFFGCTSLITVPLFNTILVSDFSNMFASCSQLATVPQFNMAAALNTTSMFQSCVLLEMVPLFNTATVTNANAMFYACSNLTEIPALNFSAVSSSSNLSNTFSNMYRLTRSRVTGIKFAHNYNSCCLARNELVEIFNNLGTASGAQTLQYVSNHGNTDLSAADKAIATGKGWTLSPA